MFNYLIPIIVIIILIYGLYKKVDIFDTFLLGVKEGLKSSINLFPTMFAMIIAINLLTNSGFILDLSNTLKKEGIHHETLGRTLHPVHRQLYRPLPFLYLLR